MIVAATFRGPIAGAQVDTWHASGEGYYDVQKLDRPALRARLRTDAQGRFWFWSVRRPRPGAGTSRDARPVRPL